MQLKSFFSHFGLFDLGYQSMALGYYLNFVWGEILQGCPLFSLSSCSFKLDFNLRYFWKCFFYFFPRYSEFTISSSSVCQFSSNSILSNNLAMKSEIMGGVSLYAYCIIYGCMWYKDNCKDRIIVYMKQMYDD